MAKIVLKELIDKIPTFEQRDKVVQLLLQLQKQNSQLQKENSKLTKKYEKTVKDKLVMSHLLLKVSDELEQSLNNEKRFVASVSHELRTPLTSILGYSELLKDTSLNNKQIKYLNRIIESSNHLLSLISDLLDVAKLDDNRIELSPKECDLDDILTECANLIRSRVSEGINFSVDIPLFNYTVKADDKRIKQIFINLLSNSAKFTKKGSIRFYVKKHRITDDNRLEVVVNVDDTGKGIRQDMLEKIFEPFQSTDKTQGTGLGLYITKQLANLMGGDIVVESKEGIGSNFSVTLRLEIARKKEIGKALKGANVIMFAPRNNFAMQVAKEFFSLGVNFQNPCMNQNDIVTLLAQMVIAGKIYELGIIDPKIFGYHTNNVAGTFKSVNPNIKLVVLADEDSDLNFSEFELVLNKPISAQRFIKSIEALYSIDSYNDDIIMDFSELKVLVVEDVDINREYEKEMLDNFFSILCDTAVNGKEAVDKARKNRYDIILMDIRMPIMDGFEATRRIREFNKETPIICMSANVYKEDKQAAKEAGMNEFIEKPLEKADIEDKFKKVLLHSYGKIKSEDEIREEESSKGDEGSKRSLKERVLNHLQERFSEDIAQRLYLKGIESVKSYLDRIEKNIQNKDTDELAEDFHALKGVLANVGLKECSDMSANLERIAKEGELIKIIDLNKELFESLDELVKD
jgi:signal transduction histidine kinase/CheY-like chemotaxis protein